MAVSGNVDIFSIKVDSRLKTILSHTGVAPEMNFSSVFLHKYICSPKYRFRECSWRGRGKMPDQPKPPLKVGPIWLKFLQVTQFISENEFVLGWHTRGSH